MKPSICNSNKRSPVTPDDCPKEYWLVRVNDLSEIREVSFNHAYILPDNSVWVWSHDGVRLILLNGTSAEHHTCLLTIDEDSVVSVERVLGGHNITNNVPNFRNQVYQSLVAGDNITLNRNPETGVITINSTCCYSYEDSYYSYEDTGWIDLQAHSNFTVEGVLKMRVLYGVLYLAGTDIRHMEPFDGTFRASEIFRIPSEFELPFVIEFPVTIFGWSSPIHTSMRITKEGVASIAAISVNSIYGMSGFLISFNTSIPLGRAPYGCQYGNHHQDVAWFVGDLDDD